MLTLSLQLRLVIIGRVCHTRTMKIKSNTPTTPITYRSGIVVEPGHMVRDKHGCTYRVVSVGSDIGGMVEVKSGNGVKLWEKIENLHQV